MDTFSQGNFFFFLASSSMEEVGSAPADSKKRMGSYAEDSYQIPSIGYEIGSVNSLPSALEMKF
jgi:hypothetical protein